MLVKQINSKSKLPAYGKALADRQRWGNPPYLVAVCIGGDNWNRAKEWQKRPDVSALVLTPEQNPSALRWPVNNTYCLIEWGGDAPEKLVVELIKCLIKAGALSVTVRPLWVDVTEPPGYFENGKFVQTREMIRQYFPKKAVSNAA